MALAGSAFVKFQGDYSGMLASSKVAGAKAGGIAGAGFAKSLAKGLAVGGVAAAAVVTGLYKIGDTFNEEYKKIRVGTGATGDTLDALKGDFKAVATSVPTSFDDAGTAIADINTRLGLTGEPLRALSGQFLELSRVTGTDVAGNIDKMTRVFGDWQIDTAKQPEALDKLYRAAQNSGIGLDDLSGSTVEYGASLRNLGFDYDESLALLANFNKTGVNTSTVFSGLKRGVGNLAKAGEDVPETFRRIVGEITEMGPGTEATGKAIELFGTRAGPDLADAIAGGKFEMEDMLAAITGGSDTIMKAGEDTQDFSEKWNIFKNKVLVKLEPIAMRVFGFIGDAMDKLPGLVQDLVKKWKSSGLQDLFEDLGDIAKVVFGVIVDTVPKVVEGFQDLGDKIKPVVTAIAGFVKKNPGPVFAALGAVVAAVVIPAFVAWAVSAAATAASMLVIYAPVIAVIAVIGLLVGAVVYAYQNFETFRNVVDTVWQAIQVAIDFAWNNVIKPIFTAVKFYVLNILIPAFKLYWTVISTVFTAVWEKIKEAWAIIQPIFNTIVAFVRDTLVPKFVEIKDTAVAVFDGVVGAVSGAWGKVKPVFESIVAFVEETLVPVWGKISGAVATAFNVIPDTIGAALRMAGNLVAGFMRGAAKIAGAIGLGPVERALNSGADSADRWGEKGMVSRPGYQAPKGYAAGGFISGGVAGRDSVPAMLMPGEVVIRKSSVDKFGASNLLDVNEGRMPFARGGIVPGYARGGEVGEEVRFSETMKQSLFEDTKDLVGSARKVLAGALERIWPTLDVPESIAGIPKGGFNNFRQSAIDFVRGKSQDIIDAEEAAEHSRAGSGSHGLAGSSTGINPDFLRRYNQYSSAVGGLSIVSGFRSYAKQAALYQKYLNGTGNLAARPGRSNHERGLAIDHAPRASASMKATARNFRLHYPVRGEPWHVEPFANGGQVPVASHRKSFDSGGTLEPGWNMVRNDTGADEHLRPAGQAPLIGEAHFHDGVDIDLVTQKLSQRVLAGSL